MTDHTFKFQKTDTKRLKAGDRILMPSRIMIEDYIRALPDHAQGDVSTMRTDLAERYDSAVTCPVTTGIHLLDLATEANDAYERGDDDVLPIWRVLDRKASVVKKFTFDPTWIFLRRVMD